MAFLIIEFAAKKTDLLKLRDEILTTIQHRNITVDSSSSPEEVGILADIEQTPLFRYRCTWSSCQKWTNQFWKRLEEAFLTRKFMTFGWKMTLKNEDNDRL